MIPFILVSISKPYDIAVVDISAESAAVSWKTTETPIKIERFKVRYIYSSLLKACHCNNTPLTRFIVTVLVGMYQRMIRNY